MRTRSMIRRSVALTATTALMSGGLASGFLASAAWAVYPEVATITKVSPGSWDNRSSVTLTVTGSNFGPNDSVILQPACSDDASLPIPSGAPCAPLAGTEVGNMSYAASAASPTATTLTATVNLSMAPPGRYHVVVKHGNPVNTTSSPFDYFRVFAYGSANASSTTTGLGAGGLDPFGADCTVEISNTGCGRNGPLPLDVKGSNFAIGAKVELLRESDNTVDTGLPFVPGNPSNDNNARGTDPNFNTGYPSSTLIQGDYDTVLDAGDQTAKFTPGWHLVRVVNTDGKVAGTTARFAQPYFAPTGALSLPTAANPNPAPSSTIGQGAKNRILRVTGQGIRAGSTLFVERKPQSNPSCADLTVGPSTLGGYNAATDLYTTIEAPLTFADCSSPNNDARQVGIVGPEGGRFFRSGVLQIGGYPTFTKFEQAQYATLGQGAHEGFDGNPGDVLVIGTNFEGAGETDPAKMTSFDFGPGVTATTRSVNPTGASAFISIDVDGAAGTGERTVRATNPNGGSKVSDCSRLASGDCNPSGAGPLFEITEGPKITKVEVAPGSPTQGMSPGQASQTNFKVTGTAFQASGYSPEQFIVALPGQTTQDPNVQLQAVLRESATVVTFQATALPAATAGPRDLIIENDDHGRFVCSACLGIDSLAVSPTSAANTGTTSPPIGMTVLIGGLPPLTSSSTVTMTHQTPLPGQPAIVGTAVAATSSTQGSAVFDLTNAALGRYNVTVVLDPAAATPTKAACTGCFTVTGEALNLDGTSPVSPNNGGQGAINRLLTFKGTGFTTGLDVKIPDVTVHDVTFVSSTRFTAQVDLAPNAEPGEQPDSTVTGGDGVSKTFTFTVNPAPTIKTSSPASYGAGAGSAGSPTPAPTISATGTGFATSPVTQLVLGLGTEVTGEAVTKGDPPTGVCPICLPGTDDSITGNLAIAQGATLGKRPVAVVNDDGGQASLADAFTINPGPKVTTVANSSGQPILCRPGGAVPCTNPQSITVLGSDFPQPAPTATDAEKSAAFKLQNTDGTDATGVTVANIVFAPGKITADVTVDAARPYGALRVAIFNATDKGFGTCDTCVTVANPPSAPGSLKLTPGGGSLTATWAASAANGSPVTTYHLTIQRVGTSTVTPADVAGTTLTKTFTGLVNGASYVVRVQGVNAAGVGVASSATGIAGVVTKLTSAASTRLLVAGSPVRFSGKLAAGTAPVAGRVISLRFTPAVGSAFTKTTRTNTAGGWAYVFVTKHTFKMQPSFAGDSTYRASSAAAIAVSVRAKVVITSPATTSTSGARTTLKISGYVFPNKARTYVYLYRYVNGARYLVARTVLTSSSTYTFSGTPKRGTYVFRVYVGATRGNLANYSKAITVRRV